MADYDTSAPSRNPPPDAFNPISLDLPPKEALYLFLGFSSYMRAPMQGSRGIDGESAMKNAVKLLEHARSLAQQPLSNVQLLHLKYRFRGSSDWGPKQSIVTDTGASTSAPISQPFSVLHDPVLKIDYKDSGTFNPMPVPAISRHISQYCHPLPRVIVVSYVASDVTETHVAGLAAWAVSQQPPIYVFSPDETRIRELRPLPVALGNAIPVSMYGPPSLPPAGESAQSRDAFDLVIDKPSSMQAVDDSAVRRNLLNPHTTRIPLWTLASGAGFLAGFTSKTWEIKISDFYACHLPERLCQGDPGHPWQGLKVRTPQSRSLGKLPSRSMSSGSPLGAASPLRSSPLHVRTRSIPHHMTKGWRKENKERMEDALDAVLDTEVMDQVVDDLITQMGDAMRLLNDASHHVDHVDQNLQRTGQQTRASGMLLMTLG